MDPLICLVMGIVISCLSAMIVGLLPFPSRLSDIFHALKWILVYLKVRIYKNVHKSRLGFYDLTTTGQPEKVGFLSHPTEGQMESPQSESHLLKADDGIFFYGLNSKGDLLIVRIARLPRLKAEAMVYLRLASGKVYELQRKSDFQQSSGDKNAFTCGALQAYYLCPMKRWRIFYSGYLKETSEDGSNRMAYVKFSFLWRASSDIYDNTSDLHLRNIADSVAREDWKNSMSNTHKLLNTLDFYAQSGVVMGNVFFEDSLETYEMYLFGERIRFLGEVLLSKEIEFSHTFGFVPQNGMHLHFGQASITDIVKNVNYGFVIKPSGSLRKFEELHISTKTDTDSRGANEIKASLQADRSYTFHGSVLEPTLWTGSKERTISVNVMHFLVDGKRGSGIHIKGQYNVSPKRKESEVQSPEIMPECAHPLVVAFTEDLCQLAEITGGKGSSLGKLSSLSSELQTFTVPAGVVVTTASYRNFVNADVLNEIKYLEDALYGNNDGDSKEASKRVMNKIIEAKIPDSVVDNIVKTLHKMFGDGFESVKFAVRSSATGEDTEQMSAAGQMDTFLGITGLQNILTAIRKCWASQFGFTAIQYKRRYGQHLNSPMAVVIQEMVACDVAGVIFTCNPISGNSSRMSIGANYGLGESVVSASVDPDTIELVRDENDDLKILNVTSGQKSQRVVLTEEGTVFEDNSENERNECCLSSENMIRLGNLAVQIEKHYRSKRDIEWGIKNDRLFLFQSRPVTSGTQETDFEIEHEFDGTLRVENDYFSVSNSAEVLPGAMAPLSRDLLFKINHVVFQGGEESEFQSNVKARYFDMNWTTMCNHAMFNIADVFKGSKPNQMTSFERALMVGFFGRIVDNKEIFEIAYDRYFEDLKPPTWKSSFNNLKSLIFDGNHVENTQKHYENYRIPVEKYNGSKYLFNGLMERCCDVSKALLNILLCNQVSSLRNMTILTVLSQDKEDIDSDVYTDFSKIITVKGDVESADVPVAIENLVAHIARSITPEVFKAMKTEEALQWLKETPSAAGKTFSEFLTKHGHRGFKEFDIYSTTWGSDPKSLVKLLQNFVGNVSKETVAKENESLWKQIMQLKTPLGRLSQLKLLLLVPLSRKGVQKRETAKSTIIKAFDGWRKAMWELARRMVSEGRIPDEKILFFMTLDEVKELLDSRSPKILAKAYHRQRLYPKINEYRFPEIMKGIPQPINSEKEDNSIVKDDFSMQGIPVSQGVVKGYIRVAVTLDEAASLKPGEILLAYGTDIGWTPYFPTLAGVATELGGLISHGAVISREYGLPCVVGLHGATRKFQTGDYVLLDGNKGLLQKIPPPVESINECA